MKASDPFVCPCCGSTYTLAESAFWSPPARVAAYRRLVPDPANPPDVALTAEFERYLDQFGQTEVLCLFCVADLKAQMARPL